MTTLNKKEIEDVLSQEKETLHDFLAHLKIFLQTDQKYNATLMKNSLYDNYVAQAKEQQLLPLATQAIIEAHRTLRPALSSFLETTFQSRVRKGPS